MFKTLKFTISGVVQGVGFRPFIYSSAVKLNINGYVLNSASGVEIVAQGDTLSLDTFTHKIESNLPPLARIDSMDIEELHSENFRIFEIRHSDTEEQKSVAISADMAICKNCLKEMKNGSDRRHNYFLINCTDCGPRYSIIKTVPYDRPNTSMKLFEMCSECKSEYNNPLNRRYHAQPISCFSCGPKIHYLEDGKNIEDNEAIESAVNALKSGKILSLKGLGGFHLMCNALNNSAVKTLRERKKRPSKPFAVMFKSIESVREYASISKDEEGLIASKERPIVLVKKGLKSVAPSVAPKIDRVGVFLPYTPLHHLIFEKIDFPLIATSANMSDEPIIRDESELNSRLSGVADSLLTHDREIVNACDDSVLQVLNNKALMLRLARGFAPTTIPLRFKSSKKILAVGANQKNSIALAFGENIILSPHIGDLGSIEAFDYFERTLETFKSFYDFTPELIVCDMHPEYETTKWALSQKAPTIQIQHHHAHILSVMAEYNLDEKVLGFAFDGTGYGSDGTIWGGEVLRADTKSYERIYYLKPFRLLGGEKAVREPRRVALSLLFEQFSLEEVLNLNTPTVDAFSKREIGALHSVWSSGLNSPLTSSMGRVFDAISSMLNICQSVSYEGESGLLLEAEVNNLNAEPYEYVINDKEIDLSPMMKEIVYSLGNSAEVSSRFIATIADIMVKIAKESNEKVVLSGGVFQNITLLKVVTKRFENEGIEHYVPSRFSVNDGSIALGQLWGALKNI